MSRSKKEKITVAPAVEPIAVDVTGAARRLAATVRQIRTLAAAGEFPAIPLGKKHVYRITDLDAFLDRRARGAA